MQDSSGVLQTLSSRWHANAQTRQRAKLHGLQMAESLSAMGRAWLALRKWAAAVLKSPAVAGTTWLRTFVERAQGHTPDGQSIRWDRNNKRFETISWSLEDRRRDELPPDAGQRRPPRGRVRAFRSRRTVIGRGVGSTAGRLAPLQWAPTKDTGNAVFPRFGAPSCVSAERMPPTQAARSTPHRGMRPAGLPAPRVAQPSERQHAADDAPPRRNSEQEPGW